MSGSYPRYICGCVPVLARPAISAIEAVFPQTTVQLCIVHIVKQWCGTK